MPPPYSKLIIISNNVKDIDIIQSRLLGDVASIIVDYKELEQSIDEKIKKLEELNLTHIALMFDNTKSYAPFIEYTSEQLNITEVRKGSIKPLTLTEIQTVCEPSDTTEQEYNDDISDIVTIDRQFIPSTPVQSRQLIKYETTYNIPNPDYEYFDMYNKNELQIPDSNNNYKFFSIGFIALINNIKLNNPLLNNLDIISCNIKDHLQFTQLGLTVRYHDGIIGGDNWTLSAGNINTIGLYFTSTIVDYKYKLGGIPPPLVGGCYQITIPDHLYWLMTYTSNAVGTPNLSSTFCLGANIDMTGYLSEPIGKTSAISTEWFIGSFDGNGYTITIDTVINNYNGLFGAFGGLVGSTPYNAILQNVNVVYKQPSYTLTPPVGGSDLSFGFLIALHQGGQCTNNTVSFNTSNNPITVVVNNNINGAYLTSVGGMIGRMTSLGVTTLQPLVTTCSIVSTVPITIQVYSPRGCFVGGVIGGAEITPAAASNLGIFGITANFSSLIIQAVRISLTTGSGVADEVRVGGFLGYISSISGTNTLFVKNNNFTCNNLTMDSNLPGGLTTSNLLITMYTGGFIGYIDRVVSVDTNNVTISIFNCTQTLYRAYASSNIARATSTTNFPEIKNMNINIGDNIYNISNIGGSNSYIIGNIIGSADSTTALPIFIQNIVYTSNNTICNIINTLLGVFVNPFVGGLGVVSAQTFTLAINIINVTYNSNSFTLTSNVLNSSLNFGGFIAAIINSVCSISGCIININNISVVRTGVTSAYTGGSSINVGGLIGLGRPAISNTSICNINNLSVLSDINAFSYIGGVIGTLQAPATTPVGASYTIQNNIFNIGIINITLTGTVGFRRTMLFGGFIGEIVTGSASTNSTLSRSIINNTINIQKIDINITRSVAPSQTGIATPYAIGGIFGNIFGAGTYPNILNPMLVNNLTANLGNMTINGPDIENDICTSVLIGSCLHANFTISNCILNATSLLINCTGPIITGLALGAGYGCFSGSTLVTRGIFNSSQVTIGYLSIIFKPMANCFVGLLSARPSITLFFANSNNINIGPNTYIEVSQRITASLFPKIVGLLLGFISLSSYNGNIIVNNTITIQDPLTMKGLDAFTYLGVINFSAPGGTITNVSNKVYLKNNNYQLQFNTIPLVNAGLTNSVIADGISYQLFPIPNTIKTSTGYSLTYSQFTLIFFFEEVIQVIPITCCTANICDANSQTANQDSSTAIQSQSGQQLVSAVNDFYTGAARGQIRPNAPPIFKTYGQMMEWKQRQNRR